MALRYLHFKERDMEEFIGQARSVRELIALLQSEKISRYADLEIKGTDDSFSMVEVYYDSETDTVILL